MTIGIGNGYDDIALRKLYATQPEDLNGSRSSETSSNPISFSSGADETKNIEDIEAEYAEAEAALGKDDVEDTEMPEDVQALAEAQAVQSTTSTTAATGESSEKIKEEIEELEAEKEENIEKMEKIEDEIENLAESAEKHIMEAAKAQETTVKEHEEETQAVLDENIQAYINANKEGGEGMTRDELQENIKSAMQNTPEIADAVGALAAASEEVAEIDNCLGELNKLITDTQLIEEEIELKNTEYEAAKKAEEKAKSCDPIGFTATDKDGNQAQYDFIIDDGAFDTTSDFLGADSQWSEMTALDTDGDNIVSAAELQAGNIKAVKTNADGSQEIVDLAEEFGEDFSVDLASYQEGGSHSAVDTTTDSDGDGTADQTMLGTFNVNANGQTINGYNTLDDVDWLAENYGISADTAETETNGLDATQFSEDLKAHVNFFNMYTEKSEELKKQIKEGYSNIGLSEEQMNGISEATKKEADEEAKTFLASLDKKEEVNEEIAEDGTKGQTAEDNNVDTTEDSTTPLLEDKVLEEELTIAA